MQDEENDIFFFLLNFESQKKMKPLTPTSISQVIVAREWCKVLHLFIFYNNGGKYSVESMETKEG